MVQHGATIGYAVLGQLAAPDRQKLQFVVPLQKTAQIPCLETRTVETILPTSMSKAKKVTFVVPATQLHSRYPEKAGLDARMISAM